MLDGKTRLHLAMLPYMDIKRIATKEEIRQHDEEYEIRKKYWHVLAYVDGVREGDATEDMHRDGMEHIYKRLKEYDLSGICNLPNHTCTCSGAGLQLAPAKPEPKTPRLRKFLFW